MFLMHTTVELEFQKIKISEIIVEVELFAETTDIFCILCHTLNPNQLCLYQGLRDKMLSTLNLVLPIWEYHIYARILRWPTSLHGFGCVPTSL